MSEIIYTEFPIYMSIEEHKVYFDTLMKKYKFINIENASIDKWEDYYKIRKSFGEVRFPEMINTTKVILEADVMKKTFKVFIQKEKLSSPILSFTEFVDYIIKIVPVNNFAIGEKWTDSYLQRLGIIDHCNELIQINNNIIREKNLDNDIDLKSLKLHFDAESMDLLLILEEWAKDKEELKQIRINKFLEKQEAK